MKLLGWLLQGVKAENIHTLKSIFCKKAIASTETNETWEESSIIQLSYDILKKIVTENKPPKEVLEGKKSKTLHAHVKNQENMLFVASRRGVLLIMPCPQTFQLQKTWISDLSVVEVVFYSVQALVLEKGWRFFLICHFEEIKEITWIRKISSSLFQKVFANWERTISSTETNDSSNESSDTQLFGNRKFEDMALSRGRHAPSQPKNIEIISK